MGSWPWSWACGEKTWIKLKWSSSNYSIASQCIMYTALGMKSTNTYHIDSGITWQSCSVVQTGLNALSNLVNFLKSGFILKTLGFVCKSDFVRFYFTTALTHMLALAHPQLEVKLFLQNVQRWVPFWQGNDEEDNCLLMVEIYCIFCLLFCLLSAAWERQDKTSVLNK